MIIKKDAKLKIDRGQGQKAAPSVTLEERTLKAEAGGTTTAASKDSAFQVQLLAGTLNLAKGASVEIGGSFLASNAQESLAIASVILDKNVKFKLLPKAVFRVNMVGATAQNVHMRHFALSQVGLENQEAVGGGSRAVVSGQWLLAGGGSTDGLITLGEKGGKAAAQLAFDVPVLATKDLTYKWGANTAFVGSGDGVYSVTVEGRSRGKKVFRASIELVDGLPAPLTVAFTDKVAFFGNGGTIGGPGTLSISGKRSRLFGMAFLPVKGYGANLVIKPGSLVQVWSLARSEDRIPVPIPTTFGQNASVTVEGTLAFDGFTALANNCTLRDFLTQSTT